MTAAEAHILLKGVHGTGVEAFRLAITELLVRRRAALGSTTVRRFILLRKRVPLLSVAGAAPQDSALRSVWEVIAKAQDGSRPALASDVAHQAWLVSGELDSWARKVVAQALIDREDRGPGDSGNGGGGGDGDDFDLDLDLDLDELDFGLLEGIDIATFDSFDEAYDAIGDSLDSGSGGDGDGGNGD